MKIGLGAPVSGAWATPETLTRVAVRAEELGYDSLWTFQRLLVGSQRAGTDRKRVRTGGLDFTCGQWLR